MVEDKSLLLNSVSEMDSEEGDVFAMRINLSVTIVGLVNNTPLVTTNRIDKLWNGNITEVTSFDWGEREQGWLLGAFFYGYVATQITGGRMVEKYGCKKLYCVSSAKKSLAERSNGMMMRRQASMDNVLECPVGVQVTSPTPPRPSPGPTLSA